MFDSQTTSDETFGTKDIGLSLGGTTGTMGIDAADARDTSTYIE